MLRTSSYGSALPVGHRLSKIYTRTGDDGTTGLANGERIDKCDQRVEAFGDVDETNSAIGLVLAGPALPAEVRQSRECPSLALPQRFLAFVLPR